MTNITTGAEREIIDDFAEEIIKRKRTIGAPKKAVIYFRNEQKDHCERPIYDVPIEILRFRKDNGRIASDVLSYEKNLSPLSEQSQEDQEKLEKFLFDKDREKTEKLINSLRHSGQIEPAVITCDGFLINGNRRKMALKKLSEKYPNEERFKTMRVVILPRKGEEGGPPTLKEIELIENRYQLQSDGKADYYNFDRALSMRHKIDIGISLEEQLRDDPDYSSLTEREFKKKVEEMRNEYLGPLDCVDKYLQYLGRDGLYNTVSEGRDDREGRWQAFIDYYQSVHKKLLDEKQRIKMGVEEDEIGRIEDAAFKIIRKRELSKLGKVHSIIRELPKLISEPESKKEIIKISNIDNSLTDEEKINKDGDEYDLRVQDAIWGKKNEKELMERLYKAKGITNYINESEAPLDLLQSALNKLEHDKMDLRSIQISELDRAMDLVRRIAARIKFLESEGYRIEKDRQKLKKNKSN